MRALRKDSLRLRSGSKRRFTSTHRSSPLRDGSSEESLHRRLRKLASGCVNAVTCKIESGVNVLFSFVVCVINGL